VAQVAQRRFIILNLFETFLINCLDGQDEHGSSFIAPAVASGFFILFSKVWHIFLSIFILLLKCVHTMTLVACCLALVSWFVEAWRLQLGAIDQDPGTKLLPVITHDLELSCDGQQLALRSV